MKSGIFVFTVFAVVFLGGQIQPVQSELPDEVVRAGFPYAVLNSDSIDFGTVERGAVISGRLQITNEGAYDLLIVKVRSSCGLLIQTWPSAPVKPGEMAVINFRYDSNIPGPFERLITLHTNAWQKNLVVKVKGEVVQRLAP